MTLIGVEMYSPRMPFFFWDVQKVYEGEGRGRRRRRQRRRRRRRRRSVYENRGL
jgi:hypothetical protein